MSNKTGRPRELLNPSLLSLRCALPPAKPPLLLLRTQGFTEELLQRQSRKKLLHDYAQELLNRHPQMAAEIGDRLDSLETQWTTAERRSAGLGSTLDPDLLPQILAGEAAQGWRKVRSGAALSGR